MVVEWFKQKIESFIKKSEAYRELEKDCSNFDRENIAKERKISEIKSKLKFEEERASSLEEQVKLLEQEKSRAFGQTGALTAKANKLEKENLVLKNKIIEMDKLLEDANRKIDFLKNCKRAPNLEEIKDYTQKRKRKIN